VSSPWIDVAVAVVFVFFVFSLIVSGLNELLNWVGQVRSKQLWSALHRLAVAETGREARTQKQIASRLVRFGEGLRDTFVRVPTGRVDHRPLVQPTDELSGAPAFLAALRSTAAVRTLETAVGGRTSIRHIPPDTFADALNELAVRGDGQLQHLVEGLEPASPLRRQIEDVSLTVSSNLYAFRAEMSRWFDRHMTDLSQRYRKDVRRVMFALGLLVALATNLSAIDVVSSAQRDSDLRQALGAAATQAVAGSGVAAACPTGAGTDPAASLRCLRDEVGRARSLRVTSFWDLGGPCRNGRPCSGWVRRVLDVPPAAAHAVAHHPLAALGRLLGWLVSAIALSFGAAFWFDLLKRLVGYRRPSGAVAR
jgi:hypothetical protein